MREMKAIILTVALAAPALFAQDQDAAAAKRRAEELTTQLKTTVAGGFLQTFDFVGGQMVSGNPVKGAPYSAEAITEMTQTLADGNRIVNKSSSMLYRDSEGRERREESFNKLAGFNASGEAARAVFITDPVAKTSYSLDTKGKTAHKMPAPMVTTFARGGGAGASVMSHEGQLHVFN